MVGRKLSGYTEQPPRDLFARIERSLGEAEAAAVPTAKAPKKRIRIIYRYMAAAAILTGVVFSTTLIRNTKPVTVTAEHTGTAITPEKVITPESIAVENAAANGIAANFAEPAATNAEVVKTASTDMGTGAAQVNLADATFGNVVSTPSTGDIQYVPARRKERNAAADEESRRRKELERTMQIEDYWGDLFYRIENESSGRRTDNRTVASLYAGNFGAGSGDLTSYDMTKLAASNMLIKESSSSIPSGPMGAPNTDGDQDITLRHRMPLNFGVSLMFPISDRLSIVSGLNYSYLYSSTTQPLSTGEGGVKQELHYLGIPVGVRYSFYRSRFMDFYLRGGGSIEKAVYATRTEDYGEGITPNVSKMGINGVQLSVDGAAGADFRLTRSMGMYLEAGAAYYFKGGNESANFGTFTSYRTDNPVNFTLRIGVRFNI